MRAREIRQSRSDVPDLVLGRLKRNEFTLFEWDDTRVPIRFDDADRVHERLHVKGVESSPRHRLAASPP